MKLKNFYYYTAVLLLFFVIVFNLVIITKRPAQAIGIPVGGRIILLTPCLPPPPVGPNPICVAFGCAPSPSNMGGMILPFGFSATTFCPMMGMPTMGFPITPAAVGMQILGEISAIAPISVGLNLSVMF
jgi:hypothetical protein